MSVRQSVPVCVQRDVNHPEQVMILRKDGSNYVRLLTMQWNEALEFAKLITSTARHAEEYAKANKQIAQEALLIRTGAPFSLVSDPNMFAAAMQEAQWGSPRKVMPLAGPVSGKHVGTPTLTKSGGPKNGR